MGEALPNTSLLVDTILRAGFNQIYTMSQYHQLLNGVQSWTGSFCFYFSVSLATDHVTCKLCCQQFCRLCDAIKCINMFSKFVLHFQHIWHKLFIYLQSFVISNFPPTLWCDAFGAVRLVKMLMYKLKWKACCLILCCHLSLHYSVGCISFHWKVVHALYTSSIIPVKPEIYTEQLLGHHFWRASSFLLWKYSPRGSLFIKSHLKYIFQAETN